MTDIVIHTWRCDSCQEISFRPAIELASKAVHPKNLHHTYHLCKNCESQGLIICKLCVTVHLRFVPCYPIFKVHQVDRVLP